MVVLIYTKLPQADEALQIQMEMQCYSYMPCPEIISFPVTSGGRSLTNTFDTSNTSEYMAMICNKSPGIIPGAPGAPGVVTHLLPLKQAPGAPGDPGMIPGVPGVS